MLNMQFTQKEILVMYFSARNKAQFWDVSHKIMAFERNVFYTTKVLQYSACLESVAIVKI